MGFTFNMTGVGRPRITKENHVNKNSKRIQSVVFLGISINTKLRIT